MGRTVCMTGLPARVALYDLLASTDAGTTTHIIDCKGVRSLTQRTVLFAFIHPSAAAEFIGRLVIACDDARVKLSREEALELDIKILKDCTVNGQFHSLCESRTITRVLRICKLNMHVTHLTLAKVFCTQGTETHNILAIEDLSVVVEGAEEFDVLVHFNSVKNALRGLQTYIENPFFKGCEAFFYADEDDTVATSLISSHQRILENIMRDMQPNHAYTRSRNKRSSIRRAQGASQDLSGDEHSGGRANQIPASHGGTCTGTPYVVALTPDEGGTDADRTGQTDVLAHSCCGWQGFRLDTHHEQSVTGAPRHCPRRDSFVEEEKPDQVCNVESAQEITTSHHQTVTETEAIPILIAGLPSHENSSPTEISTSLMD